MKEIEGDNFTHLICRKSLLQLRLWKGYRSDSQFKPDLAGKSHPFGYFRIVLFFSTY